MTVQNIPIFPFGEAVIRGRTIGFSHAKIAIMGSLFIQGVLLVVLLDEAITMVRPMDWLSPVGR